MKDHDIELPKPFTTVYDDVDGQEVDCYSATQVRAAIEADRKRRYEEAEVDTPTPEYMLDYAMYIAHERELRIGGHKHDEPNAIERFNAAVQRLIDGHSKRRGEPVAWRLAKEGKIGLTSYDKEQVDTYVSLGWRVIQELYTAPQSAEPVKVPSDAEIFELAHDFSGMTFEDLDVVGFGRALLARYVRTTGEVTKQQR